MRSQSHELAARIGHVGQHAREPVSKSLTAASSARTRTIPKSDEEWQAELERHGIPGSPAPWQLATGLVASVPRVVGVEGATASNASRRCRQNGPTRSKRGRGQAPRSGLRSLEAQRRCARDVKLSWLEYEGLVVEG